MVLNSALGSLLVRKRKKIKSKTDGTEHLQHTVNVTDATRNTGIQSLE
jgi:hypothetical protein